MTPIRKVFVLSSFIVLLFIILRSRLEYVEPKKYPRFGIASWYNAKPDIKGRKESLTCALRRKKKGGFYKVCNCDNKKCIFVRHNDWGPTYSLFNQGRIIDLSKEAFACLAPLEEGLVKVSVEEVTSKE